MRRACLLFQYAFRQLFSENLFTRRSKRSLSTWYGPPVIPDRDVKAYVDLVLSDPNSYLSNLLWHGLLIFAVSRVQCGGLRLFNAYSVESFNSRLVHTCSWGQVNDPAVPDFIEAGQLVGFLWWGRFMTLVYILLRKKHWLNDCFLANLMHIVHRSKAKPAMTAWGFHSGMRSKEREVYFAVVRFVLQMLHFAVGVLDERSLFGQTLYMLQYQSGLPWKQWGKTEDDWKF